ncbi:MAG: hypothetical protein RR769_03030, partial [Anaerovoracaceae bacterium]
MGAKAVPISGSAFMDFWAQKLCQLVVLAQVGGFWAQKPCQLVVLAKAGSSLAPKPVIARLMPFGAFAFRFLAI